MQADNAIVPLRIADEAFMVASTIDRCPKTMMLRELVVNALEAAGSAVGAAPQVRISACSVGGAMKLRLWNTGRGLSPDELLQITDLSSSLFKTVGLDGNFGMGAKVASLASNKFGLMYRSCLAGTVSQIVIGQRNGVYGRLRQSAPGVQGGAEVVDVTALCRAEGEHDLGHDWTEVILMGNTLEQDTVLSPYDGNPPAPADWVMQTLGRRFLRLPEGVELRLDAAVAGAETVFQPPLDAASFDRVEQVTTQGGFVLHYCYRAADSSRATPAVNPVGLGAVISEGEVYALTEGRRWALEAPTYGFTFAARLCSVLVELPAPYRARPEVYRQFLRFQDGDQRQVQFGDFGDLVRSHMPAWLKHIIDSLMPESEDYLLEIKADLQALMQQLGITDAAAAKPKVRGEPLPPPTAAAPEAKDLSDETQAAPPPDAAPPPRPAAAAPPPPRLPTPPDIIIVEDDDELAERGLAGRAARYHRASRQLFVNVRYAAFARMAAELAAEFATAAEPAAIALLSRQATEWALIRRLTRNVIHSMGKQRLGWSAEEAAAVQSPECLSLMLDDYELLKPAARERMSRLLGIEQAGGERPADVASGGAAASAERFAAELAEAEASLQRAKAASAPKLAPFYRRLSSIEVRRKNFGAARVALEKALLREPNDSSLHFDLAGLRLAQGDLDGAAVAAEAAVAHGAEAPLAALRRLAVVEARRGNAVAAEQALLRAMAAAPDSPWPHYDLAGLRMAQGDLDAAADAAQTAMAASGASSTHFVRRLSAIEARRGNRPRAVELLEQAIAEAPNDEALHFDLASLRAAQGDLDGAAASALDARTLGGTSTARGLRQSASIESTRGNVAAAEALLQQAIGLAGDDPRTHADLARLRIQQGRWDAAAEAAEAEVAHSAAAPVPALRRLADIEMRRQNFAVAAQLLGEAMAAAPDDPGPHFDLAALRMAEGDLDEAAAAAEAAVARGTGSGTQFLRRLSAVEARRGNHDRAVQALEKAIAIAARDWTLHMEMSGLRLQQGDLDRAADAARRAQVLGPATSSNVLRRIAAIELRRKDYVAAQEALMAAIAIAPGDALFHMGLSRLLAEMGDLDGAAAAAERGFALTGAASGQAPSGAGGTA